MSQTHQDADLDTPEEQAAKDTTPLAMCLICGREPDFRCRAHFVEEITKLRKLIAEQSTSRILEERDRYRTQYFETRALARRLQAKVDEQEELLYPEDRPDHARVVTLAERLFEEINDACQLPPDYEFTFVLEKVLREAFLEIRRDEAVRGSTTVPDITEKS